MDRAEWLRQEIATWGGVNEYIAGPLRKELRLLEAIGTVKKVPKKPSSKKYTADELYAMKKDEQVEIIKKLGGTVIPRLEKGRVEYILSLQ